MFGQSDPISDPAGAFVSGWSGLYDAWYNWWTAGDAGRISVAPGQAQADPFKAALQYLKDNQAKVQTYAPSQSSLWGWLDAQGDLLAAGKPAKISESTWMAQFRQLFQTLQSAEQAQGGTQPPPGSSFLEQLQGYVPLVIGAIVIALVVPPLIRALDD